MKARAYVMLSLVYSCLHVTHIALSCVLLLNGWRPLSVRERAALAEITVLGMVVSTYKDDRTADDTFKAAIRILNVYKGHDLFTNVTKSVAPDNVYNISNFGSKAKCYADVSAGSEYILFLTLFEGQLSAQYDDLFGAAVVHTEADEEEMNSYLGWEPWGEWSSCGAKCGGGRQFKSRECPHKNGSACIGLSRDVRTCNLFACQDSHDLLTLFGVRDLPTGVTKSRAHPSAYMVNGQAKLYLPTAKIYNTTLPTTFSILMKFKVEPRKPKGYFFVISDIFGKQQVAIFLGRKLKLHFLGNNYGFKMDVHDDKWHTVGLSVGVSSVTVHADCGAVMKRRLRSRQEYLGNNLVMSVGPYFSQYGNPFEGEIEQLTMTSDSRSASEQCGLPILNPHLWNTSTGLITTSAAIRHTTEVYKRVELCQRGCYNGGRCVSPNQCDCPTGYYGKRCQKALCQPKCQNDGVCVSPDLCLCKDGYYGSRCHKVKCQTSCLNGGSCVPPNRCQCPPLYYGQRCQREKCLSTCLNGGRCHQNQCHCPFGFTGRRCERRACVYEQYLIPYKRIYRKVIREDFRFACHIWPYHTCITTRLKYVLITKDTYRTAYRCN